MLLRKRFAMMAATILIALIIGAIWMCRSPVSSLTLVGCDSPGTLVFALTNQTRAEADYTYRLEAKVGDAWLLQRGSPGLMWQRPAFRTRTRIKPADGIHFCITPIPDVVLPAGARAWRLQVSLQFLPTESDMRRWRWAAQLQPRLPWLADWVRPSPPGIHSETIYGPAMRARI
jgi:hypothetical protein